LRSKKTLPNNNNDYFKTVLSVIIILYYTYIHAQVCIRNVIEAVLRFFLQFASSKYHFLKTFRTIFSTASRGLSINCNGFMYYTCPGTHYLYIMYYIKRILFVLTRILYAFYFSNHLRGLGWRIMNKKRMQGALIDESWTQFCLIYASKI